MTIKYLKVISLGSKFMIDHKFMDYFETFSHWYTILSRNINNEYNYMLFDSGYLNDRFSVPPAHHG